MYSRVHIQVFEPGVQILLLLVYVDFQIHLSSVHFFFKFTNIMFTVFQIYVPNVHFLSDDIFLPRCHSHVSSPINKGGGGHQYESLFWRYRDRLNRKYRNFHFLPQISFFGEFWRNRKKLEFPFSLKFRYNYRNFRSYPCRKGPILAKRIYF